MPDFFTVFWNIVVLAIAFFGLRFYFRRLRLSIFSGGWSDLAARRTMLGEPMELRWRKGSARVGALVYKDTMKVDVRHGGLYLQRNSFALDKTILFLPASDMQFVSRRKATWFSKAFCIFTIDGVDVWVEQPEADALLELKAA